MSKLFVSDTIYYVGVNDHKIDLFEGQYKVENGISYNSYVILDNKIAVMDTVDKSMAEEWLSNLSSVLGDQKPTYLIISHMEPDHAGSIGCFMEQYPNTVVVGNAKTFAMMKRFFFTALGFKTLEVKELDTLSLGSHTLTFVMAPMVHWPEVMVSYESSEKILFSADAFGTFGALDTNEDWLPEARRYYFNIVGKYGVQVQALLKKAATLDIQKICPLHGPVLSKDLAFYLALYDTWSSYRPEKDGVAVFYTTLHGNTKTAVMEFCELLKTKGIRNIEVYDLARDDMSMALQAAFCYDRVVFAAPTYDAGLAPKMEDFLSHLKAKSYQKRTAGLIENGTWAPMAGKKMRETLETMKEIQICEPVITIPSVADDNTREAMKKLADALI